MSEQTKPRFRNALIEEIESWQAEQLIGADLAAVLLARYPVLSQKSKIPTILLVIGAVLTGLGAILFVASNWESMSRVAKVALIVGAVACAHIGAWHCKYEPGEHPKVGSALLLLGSLFFGASIWLLGQIFNCDPSLSTGLGIWAAQCFAMAFLTRSVWMAVLLAILVPAFNASFIRMELFSAPHAVPLATSPFIPTMAVAAWTVIRCRSRASLFILMILGSLYFCLNQTIISSASAVVLGTGYGASLFALFLLLRRRLGDMAAPFLYIGTGVAAWGLHLSTFEPWGNGALDTSSILVVSAFLLATAIGVCYREKQSSAEAVAAVVFALSSTLFLRMSHAAGWVTGNLLLVALFSGMIACGIRMRKGALINLALVFIVIDIFARYFDVFFSMLDRSMFFVGGGIILLLAGWIVEGNRRKLTRSIAVH